MNDSQQDELFDGPPSSKRQFCGHEHTQDCCFCKQSVPPIVLIPHMRDCLFKAGEKFKFPILCKSCDKIAIELASEKIKNAQYVVAKC